MKTVAVMVETHNSQAYQHWVRTELENVQPKAFKKAIWSTVYFSGQWEAFIHTHKNTFIRTHAHLNLLIWQINFKITLLIVNPPSLPSQVYFINVSYYHLFSSCSFYNLYCNTLRLKEEDQRRKPFPGTNMLQVSCLQSRQTWHK